MPQDTPPVTPAAPPVDMEAGALAAIDAALSGEATPPVADPPPAADPPAADPPPADTPPAETPPASDTPPAETPPAETPPAEAPPAETPPPAAKKPSDEFGDLPTDAKAETRERFGKLKEALDARAASETAAVQRAEAAEATARQWTETVASTGASGEQFGATLGYLAAVNSGTPEGLERAYAMMKDEFTTLSKLLGKPVPGAFDPLAEHADLLADIDAERLSPERALEIAQMRARDKLTGAARTVEQDRTAAQAQTDTALASIRQFGAEEKERNPALYDAKMRVLTPAVNTVVARLPPAEWLPAIRRLYAETEVQVAPLPAPPPPGNGAPDSIRPGGNVRAGGSVDKVPTTALEAMEAVLRRA